MAYQNFFINPKLPFMEFIQGGLFEGKSITLTGRVKPNAERFHVNLQCGTQASADIALHFNPRYTGSSGYVVCNTRQGSSWGSEERSNHTPLPRGSDFVLTFVVKRGSYSVLVNQAEIWGYLHRLPFSCVNAISVEGDVEISSITQSVVLLDHQKATQNLTMEVQPRAGQVQESPNRRRTSKKKALNKEFWPCAGIMQAPSHHPHHHDHHHQRSARQSYVLPYKAVIHGGFYPGKSIMVQGCINPDADRFSINLRHISGIAFHFNPRFNENVVVRNSLIKEIWGPEERAGGMPFYKGRPFMVNIMCDSQCFRVSVDGMQMFTYNHRHLLLQQIDILEVDGKISLRHVTV